MQTPARAGRGGPEAERAHSHGEGCSSDEEADRVQSGDGERSPLIVPLPAPSRSTRIALMAGKPKLEGGYGIRRECGSAFICDGQVLTEVMSRFQDMERGRVWLGRAGTRRG
eukprot:3665912-Rhodomonas_salina.1